MYDVLIVEDDATLLRGLRDNFSAQGYRVRAASDGAGGSRRPWRIRPT